MRKVSQILKSRFVVFGVIPLLLMALIIPNSNLRSQITKAADNCPGTAPTQPAFNVWPLSYTPQDCHDLPMVDARVINGSGRDGRYSQSQAEHSAGINANPGDQIRVAVYFHNGASDQINTAQTTAHNTVVASLSNPTSPSTTHTISAAIAADNATAVYSSDPSVGGDFTVTTSVPTTLVFQSGSVIRYNHDGSTQNVSGDITNGVNIGDVQACFAYQGYVLYTLNVVGQQTPPPSNGALKVTKLVRNDTQGSNSFGHSATANVSDTLSWQVTVQNTSNVTDKNVVITDAIPAGLGLVAGSPSINPNGSNLSQFSAGDIAAGQSQTLTFKTMVLNGASGTITNTASAKGDNTNTDQDSASVSITAPVQGNAALSISKQVKNVTTGTGLQKNVLASQNDTVEFQITVTNTGTAQAQNVNVNDTLPNGLQLSSGSLSNSLGSIDPGNSRSVTLRATVATSTAGTYTNTATASASNASSVSDTASVTIQGQQQQNTTLNIQKMVRNASGGMSSFSKNASAQQNDLVEFRIVVTNTGSVAAQNLTVNDTLPNGFQLTNGNLSNNFGTLSPGSSATVLLTAKVTTNTAGTYTNTATASASNASSVSDTATVTVSVPVQQPGVISITKGVRDLTQGQTAYVSNTNVFNSDTLQYKVTVTNTGASPLTNLVITDQIPSGLNFVPGSLGLSMGSGTNPNNITVSSLAVNQSVTINFNATVNQSSGTITNTAQACADAVSCQTASATVNIVNQPQPANLSINKLVRNVTQNTSFTKQVSANPGDRVQYQIRITATSNTATNVVVFENIPQYLNYVSGSAKLNGNSLSDNFINQPTNVGSLSAGQTATINFDATVSSSVPNGQTFITNTATASADNVGTVSDTATVVVNVSIPSGFTQLAITKLVRNATMNRVFAKTDTAFPNDTVEFQITVTNTGTQTINNAFINDTLPQGLSFNSGTVIFNGNNNWGSPINNQMSIGSLNAGQTVTLLFRATVTAQSGATLINTAQAGGSNVNTVQDTATVFITGVAGQNVSLSFSKTAFNNTKNVDATSVSANKNDLITYTLTVSNSGNSPASNFVITDDLSNVLNNATMVDSQGGTMNGNVISWPAMNIPANSTVSKAFQVRVNSNLPDNSSLSLVNTYGNTVVVHIATPQVAGAVFIAPKTGSSMEFGFIFAGLLTAAFAIMKRKGILAAVLARVPKVKLQ